MTLRSYLKTFALLLALACVSACGSSLFIRRTVYVQDGDVLRLREPVRAKVWVKVEGEWEPSTVTLPEGWYALHLPKSDTEPR